jgi:hypothetical protein
MISSNQLEQQVTNLLLQAGLDTTILSIQDCAKSGNNRNYKLVTPDGAFAIKQYFRQKEDKRDRLASEFAFLSYAKITAPDKVPTPYSRDAETGLALYEFIDGQPLQANNITENDIAQAIDFFCALNASHAKARAIKLPTASEACFSVQSHLDLIGSRIYDLQKNVPDTLEDRMAQVFIRKLVARWQILLNDIKNIAATDDIDLTSSLEDSERCISPSDFGFHNALKLSDGTIRFLDFEYAGWDDPAKMVGDFFSQLAIIIPEKFFDHFTQAVMRPFSNPEKLVQRANLLRKVYQVKWCCIALNIFIPVHLARRQFANPDLNVVDLKKSQLIKAESLMEKLESCHYA